jgi:hypothetical protein
MVRVTSMSEESIKLADLAPGLGTRSTTFTRSRKTSQPPWSPSITSRHLTRLLMVIPGPSTLSSSRTSRSAFASTCRDCILTLRRVYEDYVVPTLKNLGRRIHGEYNNGDPVGTTAMQMVGIPGTQWERSYGATGYCKLSHDHPRPY